MDAFSHSVRTSGHYIYVIYMSLFDPILHLKKVMNQITREMYFDSLLNVMCTVHIFLIQFASVNIQLMQ